MSNKGIALIFSFIVVLVLAVLLSGLYFKSISESNMVNRYVNSMHAFWAAEAGVAAAKMNLPSTPTSGSLGDYSYEATTAYRTTINATDYYDISSVGIAPLSSGDITRSISAVVKAGPVDPTKFQYSIQAANDLCFGGGCSKDPYKYLDPENPPGCDGHDCYKEFDGTINFADMFSCEMSVVDSSATHYTEDSFTGAVSGVNWVDVAAGEELNVAGTTAGSGILVIDGNVRFEGDYEFRGIIYVLGTLTAHGNFRLYGSAVIASTSEVDDINGSPTLTWDQTEIGEALEELSFATSDIVSWSDEQ